LIVDQNLDDEMATKKVFKTMFEVRDEEAYARGYAIGISKSIRAIIKWSSLTDAEIAREIDIEESLVIIERQKLLIEQH
jgi:hypothetical protein